MYCVVSFSSHIYIWCEGVMIFLRSMLNMDGKSGICSWNNQCWCQSYPSQFLSSPTKLIPFLKPFQFPELSIICFSKYQLLISIPWLVLASFYLATNRCLVDLGNFSKPCFLTKFVTGIYSISAHVQLTWRQRQDYGSRWTRHDPCPPNLF